MTPKMLSRQAAYWILSFEIFKWVYINNPLLSTYFREVCCISYSIHHLLSIRMNFGDMWPHSLPGDSVYGKARPVHEKRDPAVFLIFLTGRPAGVVCGSGWGGFSRRTRGVTVGTGALGPTVSADLGLWAAAGGAWSGHCSEVFRGGVSPCFPQISYDCPAFMHKDMLLLEHAY